MESIEKLRYYIDHGINHRDELIKLIDAIEREMKADDSNVNMMQDSRDKLEADVQDFINSWPVNKYSLVQTDYWRVLEWFDRQAAITYLECMAEFDTLDEYAQELERENTVLRKQVDGLKKANDDYRKEWHRVCTERLYCKRKDGCNER